MSVVAVVGAQWGDEGKGRVVEVVAKDAALVVHYAGGTHAGESLMAEGERLVFHLLPSSSLRQGKTVLLAQGMAIDPRLLLDELRTLEEHGGHQGLLLVDQRAQVVLPHHVEIDRLRGEVEGASGTPRRGLGPAYSDEIGRRGLRIGDLLEQERLQQIVAQSIEAATPILQKLGGEPPELAPIVDAYAGVGERLRQHVVDGSRRICDLTKSGALVVLEGPYGTMVDLDHGYYPFVVGASTVAGGACTGTGIPPRMIDHVIGVAKAYSTRAGPGPLPSELSGDLASRLQQVGGEISPINAKPRRCGMFDVPALRYAARVNGFDTIALTKLDVLSDIDEIPICVGYELDGNVRDEPPFEGQGRMQALTELLPGWKGSLADCRTWDDLPRNARRYVETIEQVSGVRVALIGVGTDRSQTIMRGELFG